MSINNLGYYVTPLSKEERDAIYALTGKKICLEILETIKYKIRGVAHAHFQWSTRIPDLTDFDEVIRSVNTRFENLFTLLKRDYPMVVELDNPENLSISVLKDGDGFPIIQMGEWLSKINTGDGTIILDPDLIPEFLLIQKWGELSLRDKGLIDNNVPVEMKPIVEFNSKLNDISEYGPEYDYTDVIKEIIQAVKEGKL